MWISQVVIATLILASSVMGSHKRKHDSSSDSDSSNWSLSSSSDDDKKSKKSERKRVRIIKTPNSKQKIIEYRDVDRKNKSSRKVRVVEETDIAKAPRRKSRKWTFDSSDEDDDNRTRLLKTSNRNGPVMPLDAAKETIESPIGSGWIKFKFGQQSIESNRRFHIDSKHWIRLRITDLYCTGDVFTLITKDGNEEVLIGTTSTVDADNCRTVTSDPEHAYNSGAWSNGSWLLSPGNYRISIRVKSSPFDGGSAAIKFDRVSEPKVGKRLKSTSKSDLHSRKKPRRTTGSRGSVKECAGFNGYVVLTGKYSWSDSKDLCGDNGHRRADVSSNPTDYQAAAYSISECLGDRKTAWIWAYNGVTSKYLAMFAIGKEGSVNTYTSDDDFAVLCYAH